MLGRSSHSHWCQLYSCRFNQVISRRSRDSLDSLVGDETINHPSHIVEGVLFRPNAEIPCARTIVAAWYANPLKQHSRRCIGGIQAQFCRDCLRCSTMGCGQLRCRDGDLVTFKTVDQFEFGFVTLRKIDHLTRSHRPVIVTGLLAWLCWTPSGIVCRSISTQGTQSRWPGMY